MNFGCFYNSKPSPGRCIKDINSNVIEEKCEIVDNNCKLKRIQFNDNSKVVEEKCEIQDNNCKLKQKMLIKSNNNNNNNNNINNDNKKYKDKLSGPILAYITNYMNKSYNFFGDAHYSMEGNCKPCQDFNLDNLKIMKSEGSENCYDISVLLANTFTEAAKKGVWIDFYIESPFLNLQEENPNSKFYYTHMKDYLDKLVYIFYNCLNKLKCDYSTTRFHYVDIRLKYQKYDLKKLLSNLEETKFRILDENSYERYIFDRVSKSINELKNQIKTNERSKNKYIENTDKLIKDFYFSGGKTVENRIEGKYFKLFNLYLTSDNIIEDINNLLLKEINNEILLKKIKEILIPSYFIKYRRGKIMHKIRAQLEALEYEGNMEMSKLIQNHFISIYKKRSTNLVYEIKDLWTSVMLIYDNFVNAKIRKIDDALKIIDKIQEKNEEIKKLEIPYIKQEALMMDIYTLSRMFRKYLGKKHTDSVKVITYTGAAHARVYRKFFNEVLNTKFIDYYPKFDQRCLNVDINDFKI